MFVGVMKTAPRKPTMPTIYDAIFNGPMLTYWPTVKRCLMVLLYALATALLFAVWDAWHSNTLTRIHALEVDVAYIQGAARPLVQGSDGTTVNFWLDGQKGGE